MTKTKERLLFASFFFEALKPHSASIFDTLITFADAGVSAATRAEVRAAESESLLKTDTL